LARSALNKSKEHGERGFFTEGEEDVNGNENEYSNVRTNRENVAERCQLGFITAYKVVYTILLDRAADMPSLTTNF
jgi:hypothetical protein